MAAEIDELVVAITASADGATAQLDKLAKKLRTIEAQLGQVSKAGKSVGRSAGSSSRSASSSPKESARQSETAVSKATQNMSKNLKRTQEDVDALVRKFRDAGTAYEGFTGSDSGLERAIAKATNDLNNAKAKIQEAMLKGMDDKGFEKAVYNYQQAINMLGKMQEQLAQRQSGGGGSGEAEPLLDEGDSNNNVLEENVSIVDRLKNALANLRENAGNALEYMAMKAPIVASALGAIGNVLTFAISKAREVGAAIVAIAPKIASALKPALASLGKIATSALGKVAGAFNFLPNAISNVGKNIEGLTSKFSRMFKMLQLMITRTLLRSVIKGFTDGVNNVAQYSNTLGSSMSMLSSSMSQLSNSIGAAASPLINALAPALNTIIQWCISVVNAINQVLSALSALFRIGSVAGATWTKATAVNNDYAKSMGGAGGAAKKAAKDIKDATTGIDELNVIKQQDDNGGGGGGGGGALGNMFEEVDVDQSTKDFVERLKKSWEDGGDFYWLGEIFGDKVNQAIDYGLSKVGQAKDFAQKLGRSIATFINGAVETIHWYDLGRLLSEGINTSFTGLNAFVSNLNFASLGGAFSKFLNGAMNTIDWGLIQDTSQKTAKGIVTGLNVAIATVDWDGVGNTLSQYFNSVLTFLETATNGFNWSGLGSSLSTSINSVMSNLNWGSISSTISGGVTGVFNFISSFIQGLRWFDIGENIRNLILSIDWAGIFTSVATAIGSAIGGAASLIWGFIGEVVTGIKDYFAERIEATNPEYFSMGQRILLGILTGIVDAIVGIAEWIYTNVLVPFVDGVKAAFGIHSPAETMKPIGENILLGILEGFNGAVGQMLTALAEFGSNVIASVGESLGNLKESMLTKWDEIKTDASTKWDEIKTNIHTTWDAIKEKSGTIWENVKTGIGTAWDWIKAKTIEASGGVKNSTTEEFNQTRTNSETTWNSVKKMLDTTWTNIKTTAQAQFSNMKTLISGITTEISNFMNTTWTSIQNFLKQTIDNIQKNIELTFNAIKTFLVNTWNEIKAKIIETLNAIKSELENKFNEIKQNIENSWKEALETTKKVWEEIKTALSGFWNDIKAIFVPSEFGNIAREMMTNFKTSAQEMMGGIKEMFGEFFRGLIESARETADRVRETLEDLDEKTGGEAGAMDSWYRGGILPYARGGFLHFAKGGFVPDIPHYDIGGFPGSNHFSLFTAGEGGVPEILGTVGGRNAVAGGAEITGIRDSIYTTSTEEQALMQTAIQYLAQIASKDFSVELDGKSVQKQLNNSARRAGFAFR